MRVRFTFAQAGCPGRSRPTRYSSWRCLPLKKQTTATSEWTERFISDRNDQICVNLTCDLLQERHDDAIGSNHAALYQFPDQPHQLHKESPSLKTLGRKESICTQRTKRFTCVLGTSCSLRNFSIRIWLIFTRTMFIPSLLTRARSL